MAESIEKQASVYRFGCFEVNAKEQLLRQDGKIVPVTPKIFEMLLLLVQNNGRMLSKDEIMEFVWVDSFVEESNLTSNISRLRKILNAGGEQYIETYPKRGYRFRAEIEETEPETEVVLTRRVTTHVRQTVEEDDETPLGLNEINRMKSIAVLPFVTLGMETEEEFLGLSLADVLITGLSRAKQLAVRPTSAVRPFAGQTRSSAEIGRELRVGAVLEGSVQRLGERLRVVVQLVNVAAETPIWAEKFDFKFTDIFDLQDEITLLVVGVLPLQLSAAEQRKLTARWTENAEVYRLYLKARFYLPRNDPESLQKAISFFQQTIALAPEAAPAHAGLAEACIVGSYFFAPHEILRQARNAAAKAVELDSQSFEARVSLGVVKYLYDWNWTEAEQELKGAIELNPNYAPMYRWYGLFLMLLRRFDEAFVVFERALELDPLSLSLNALDGVCRRL